MNLSQSCQPHTRGCIRKGEFRSSPGSLDWKRISRLHLDHDLNDLHLDRTRRSFGALWLPVRELYQVWAPQSSEEEEPYAKSLCCLTFVWIAHSVILIASWWSKVSGTVLWQFLSPRISKSRCASISRHFLYRPRKTTNIVYHAALLNRRTEIRLP